MHEQIPLSSSALAIDKNDDEPVHEIAPELAYRRLAIVNVVYYGRPGAGDRDWVLIDTGIPGTEHLIVDGAYKRFGSKARPAAIVMTHGHFDHVGNLKDLAEKWEAPIYAHPLEMPYLNGSQSYPPPEPSVGGLMARLSPLFPRGPIDVTQWLRPLPVDGSLPYMEGWHWLHTPGHAPGHISLWNEEERALIVGDAFITTRQESAYAVATQKPEMHGPPQYFTPNWMAAEASVKHLACLEPELVITGHGSAMRGEEMRQALHQLANNFQSIAVPKRE
ncbi:MAG: MBL fold metallo-hydrolase [Nibricoccus sp.]